MDGMFASSAAALPPGPPRRAGLRLLRTLERDPLGLLAEIRSFGTIAYARIGPQPVFLVSEPDLIERVLVSRDVFNKGRALERSKQLLGEGLLTSEGDFHLRQRRLVQPAFHRARIHGYARAMVEHAERWSSRQIAGARIDLAREMNRLTLAIVARTLFDADIESEADEIGASLTSILEQFKLAVLPWSAILDRLPLPRRFRFERARKALDRVVYRLIEEHRACGEDRGDLLSMLLSAQDGGTGMTDVQVRDEAMTLLLAGHETTANALTWTWKLLSQHPGCAERLAEEVRQICGDVPPTPGAVPALSYARRVLAEGMRLYPPAWLLGRRAMSSWPLGEFTVPPGAIVLMSQWLMHRDARFFPEPLRFDPDRWQPELEASRPKYSYFPFGGGNRMCIGDSFAWTEGVLVLATIARRWRVVVDPAPVDLWPGITLRPAGPVWAELIQRA
jgi:cytochrome P450